MLRTFNRIYQCSFLLMLAGLCAGLALAQNTFNSGSTGANGAFSPTSLPTACTRSSSTITCDLPPNGIFNFTTFDLPRGNTLRFNRNARNTPAIILASGNCALGGYIDLIGGNGSTSRSGFGLRPIGGRGAVGGFDGGGGGVLADLYRNGVNGDGPGGGGGGKENGAARGGGGGGANFLAGAAGASSVAALIGAGGRPYGSFSLPVIGGSGGGGAPALLTDSSGAGGGGGGGAILIACSATMTLSSFQIDAYGGRGDYATSLGAASGGGGGGSIRLMATTITGVPDGAGISGYLDVRGGSSYSLNNGNSGGDGGTGFVRVEAFNFNSFIPRLEPDPNLSGIYFQGTPPTSLNLGASPTLRITTVAGVNVPTDPKGTFNNAPDIPFTAAPANPVTLGISAANIPLGTRATIILTPETGAITTVQSTPLAGTVAASTATASVTLPQGRSLLNAIVTIEANAQTAGLAPEFIQGERVKQIKIAAQLGGASEIVYVTESGKEIRAKSE
jgi:hypothetical protein